MQVLSISIMHRLSTKASLICIRFFLSRNSSWLVIEISLKNYFPPFIGIKFKF